MIEKVVMYKVECTLFNTWEEANKQESINAASKELNNLLMGRVHYDDKMWIHPILRNVSEVIRVLEEYLISLSKKEEK